MNEELLEKMAPLRVLVVDDEEPARLLLREYLEGLPGAELAGECGNGFEAVKKVGELSPDVLLLDVRMPKLDGFEVLELLGDAAPAVIFTTAYDEYALRAFEVHAVDYLRKPFTQERLAEALERVRRSPARLPGREPAAAVNLGRELGRTARKGQHLERVLVRDGAQIHVLPCEKLDYVEAQDDEIVLVAGKERWRKAERLGDLETALDPGRFVRIHRSYLLNVDRLARLELYAKDSRIAILRDGTRLPVSRAGFQRLRELL
jgi:two-component system LytT family response regulator